MKIFIATATGTITMEVDPSETIENVIMKITRKGDIPAEQQRFLIQTPSPLKVFIKTETGKILMFRMETFNTVENIKAKIQETEELPMERQRLKIGDNYLEDDKILLDYVNNTSKNSEPTLFFELQLCGILNITILTVTQRTFNVTVKTSDTVEILKRKICAQKGIEPWEQRLFFHGRDLENNKSMDDYNIGDGFVLHLAVRVTV